MRHSGQRAMMASSKTGRSYLGNGTLSARSTMRKRCDTIYIATDHNQNKCNTNSCSHQVSNIVEEYFELLPILNEHYLIFTLHNMEKGSC